MWLAFMLQSPVSTLHSQNLISYNNTNRCLLIIPLFSNKLGIPKDMIAMLWVFTKY